jgi:hypothetical protein
MAEGLVRGEGFATDTSIIKADAQRQRGVATDKSIDGGNPEEALRPVREYLAGLEVENPTDPTPKVISLTDPSASWTAAPGGAPFYAYHQSGDGPTISQPWRRRSSVASCSVSDAMARCVRTCSSNSAPARAGV